MKMRQTFQVTEAPGSSLPVENILETHPGPGPQIQIASISLLCHARRLATLRLLQSLILTFQGVLLLFTPTVTSRVTSSTAPESFETGSINRLEEHGSFTQVQSVQGPSLDF